MLLTARTAIAKYEHLRVVAVYDGKLYGDPNNHELNVTTLFLGTLADGRRAFPLIA